jgi:hypothetical protein
MVSAVYLHRRQERSHRRPPSCIFVVGTYSLTCRSAIWGWRGGRMKRFRMTCIIWREENNPGDRLPNIDFSGERWARALSFMIVDVGFANCHWHWHFLRVREQSLCFPIKSIQSDGWAHWFTLKYAHIDISLPGEEHNFILLAWDILDCRSAKLRGQISICDIESVCWNMFPSWEFHMIPQLKFIKITGLYLKTTKVSSEYETEKAFGGTSQKWDPSQSPTIIYRRWLNQ